eukprot:jgi/Chlat1/306/Chrsp1S08784
MASAAVSLSMLLSTLLLLALSGGASAATWVVGDSGGWGFGVDYAAWAAAHPNIRQCDTLVFNYAAYQHNVVKFSNAASFSACNFDTSSQYVQVGATEAGQAKVVLGDSSASSTYRFACQFYGHCGAGMHMALTAKPANCATKFSSSNPTGENASFAESYDATKKITTFTYTVAVKYYGNFVRSFAVTLPACVTASTIAGYGPTPPSGASAGIATINGKKYFRWNYGITANAGPRVITYTLRIKGRITHCAGSLTSVWGAGSKVNTATGSICAPAICSA